MTLDDDLPPILTVEQTAELLGISRGLAFTAVRAGQIPSLRIGRRILIPRDELLRIMRIPSSAESGNELESRTSHR